MTHNIFKFNHYPFLRLNLNNCNFKMNLCDDFKKTYNQLPFDKYINNNTRKRRYANYHVKNIDDNLYSIFHTGVNTFTQDVEDFRKDDAEIVDLFAKNKKNEVYVKDDLIEGEYEDKDNEDDKKL